LFAVVLGLAFGMAAIRRRATTRIKSALAITDAEASRLLNTPPWRTTVWRKPSSAALLAAAPPAAPLVGPSVVGEAPTRVSSRSGAGV